MVHIIGKQENDVECPVCQKPMVFKIGKKGAIYVCYRCKVSIGVTDPLILAQNLKKEGTMMKPKDKVIIDQLEWEVTLVKNDRDALLRRPNPKNKKLMDFGIVEVIDFVFDKQRKVWVEVETLPADGDGLFKG